MSNEQSLKHCAEAVAKRIDVAVIATRHEDEGVDFHCTWEDSSGAWHSGPIVLPPKSGAHEIEFKLDDRTDLDLKFLGTADEAIWVNADSCPTSAQGNDKGQIKNKRVETGDKKLTLENVNEGDPCILHYALRFTGKPWTNSNGKEHRPPYAKDPEFRNGGRV